MVRIFLCVFGWIVDVECKRYVRFAEDMEKNQPIQKTSSTTTLFRFHDIMATENHTPGDNVHVPLSSLQEKGSPFSRK